MRPPMSGRWIGARARTEEVPLQEDDPDERDEDDAELRLDHGRDHGERGRAFGVAADQRATPMRMTRAPAASVWPQSAESYQVTGLNR